MLNNLGARVWERFQKRDQDECQLRTYFITPVENWDAFSIHAPVLVKMHLNVHSRGCWARGDTQLGLDLWVFDSSKSHAVWAGAPSYGGNLFSPCLYSQIFQLRPGITEQTGNRNSCGMSFSTAQRAEKSHSYEMSVWLQSGKHSAGSYWLLSSIQVH